MRSSTKIISYAENGWPARSGPPGRGAGVNGALSMTGLQLGFMFGGVLVVEEVFTRPGLRSYLAASLAGADFPAVAGVTFVLAGVYIVANTVVDILQALADPRITLCRVPPR